MVQTRLSGARYRALLLPLLLSACGHGAFLLLAPQNSTGGQAQHGSQGGADVPALRLHLLEAPAPVHPQATTTEASKTIDAASGAAATPLYYKLSQLDGPLLPVTAPDTSRLRRLVFSGQAIRLRLWITAQGRVEHIDVLRADASDQDAVAEVQAMYYDTAYMPPQRHGQAVAARMDIEMDFTPELIAEHAMTLIGSATPAR